MKNFIKLAVGLPVLCALLAVSYSCNSEPAEEQQQQQDDVTLTVNGRNIKLGEPSNILSSARLASLSISYDNAINGADIVITTLSQTARAAYKKTTTGILDTDWRTSGKLKFVDQDIMAIRIRDDDVDQYYRFLVYVSPPHVNHEHQTWALTPPMGWNSYDAFGCNVTEAQVKANADYMAEHLLQYGYEYIVVDGRWFCINQTSGYLIGTSYNQQNVKPIMQYDEWGRYTPAVNKFPSAADDAGFKPLADYVHSLGLKFGLHIMRGIPVPVVEENLPVKGAGGITAQDIYSLRQLCAWNDENYTIEPDRPGAQEYYDSVFELYAEWGVDYVKVDDISRPYHTGEIEMIRKAIERTGRPMILSLSPGDTHIDNAAHVKEYANMWRMTDDVWDRWGDVVHLLERAKPWYPDHIGPGYWPDADMMPFGVIAIDGGQGGRRNCRLSSDEQHTLMTLFAIMRSPLMFGGNLPDNNPVTNNLITDQDALYIHKHSINNRLLYESVVIDTPYQPGQNRSPVVAWTADDAGSDDKFLALFNCGPERPGHGQALSYTPRIDTVPFDLALLGFTADTVTVRDLWEKKDIGEFAIAETFEQEIPLRGVKLYRLSPVEP